MSQGPTRRKHTKEYKLEAVRRSNEANVFITDVARDLGIRVKDLYRWRAEFRNAPDRAFPGNGHSKAPEGELERLRRENETLRLEQEILKKAAAFFARPLLPGTHS